jgi:hypothetical protein
VNDIERLIYAAAFAGHLANHDNPTLLPEQAAVYAHRAGMAAVDCFRLLNDAQRARVSP